MITGWLVKILIGLAVAGFLIVELGSPVIARIQLDDLAHDVADDASRSLARGRSREQIQAEAVAAAVDEDATLDEFSIDEQGKVHVTVSKDAKSYLLHRFEPTEDWYHVTVKADR